MADNVTVDNGALTDFAVSADEGAGGYLQRMKLCYSADGAETHVPADANGLKVNGSGVTQPVSDAGGSLTVDGTFWQATQPVSAAALPLPSGAAQEHNTAASPHSARLTDGTTYLGTTAQRLHVDDGGSSLSVDDNGSSLTVDSAQLPGALAAGGGIKVEGVAGGVAQPVSGTFFQATQPVSLATNTPDVTDRDARLLGRGKVLDSAGSVIDPTTKAQLPAALAAGGGMKVEGVAGGVAQPVSGTFWQATQPVSGTVTVNALPAGSNNIGDVDVLTLPALVAGTAEVGKVQLSDGTDVATVLPVRTQPATTEKALTTVELPSRMATYAVSTAEVAPAITIGVKEGLCLWHVSSGTKDIYIVELWAAFIVTTASTTGGRTTVRVSTVTTAPTGGTDETIADIGGAGASTEMTNRMRAKTGGGAIGATFIRQGVEYATQPLGNQRIPLFTASTVGNGIVLRAGSGQGISIDVERVVAHTALADQWTFGARWIEL